MMDVVNETTFIQDYLTACGVQDVETYLSPDKIEYDHFGMYDNLCMAAMVFTEHMVNGSKVGIVQDSDSDGSCSAAITYLLIREFSSIEPIIYTHTGKQHGLEDLMEQIKADRLDLLIIPDAGSNDVAQCMELKSTGVDIIILDHHVRDVDNPYALVVNPYGNSKPVNKSISGTGVVEKFARSLGSAQDFRDIVAISLVSDSCSLLSHENRKYIYEGLTNPSNPFIKYALGNLCNRGICSEGVAFGIAPLGNALSRQEDEASKLLFFDALVGKIVAEDAVKAMKSVKAKQDYQVKKLMSVMEPSLDMGHKVLFGFAGAESKNYLGLVANKVCGKYGKPTFMLRELDSTTWSGSMRSPIDLLQPINESRLAKCMGHDAACGIVIKKSNLKRFAKFVDSLELEVEPSVNVAASLLPDAITTRLAKLCADNAILWGKDIPKPMFHVRLDCPQPYIYKNRSTTAKLVYGGIDFIKFFANGADVEALQCANNKMVDVAVTLSLNEYNGVVKPQAIIESYDIAARDEPKPDIVWEDIFK